MKNATEVTLYKEEQTDEKEQYFKDLCEGLGHDSLKQVSSKCLYDEEGSRLFAALTQSEEYYLWCSEKKLLETHADQFLEVMMQRGAPGEKFNVIDLGAGDGTKTRIVLEAALARGCNFEYIPIDISRDSNLTLSHNL